MHLQRQKQPKKLTSKVTNEQRRKLIEMVYVQNCPLWEASKLLKINYSTSKGILRVFRNEKRVNKKNISFEDNLPQFFQTSAETEEQSIDSSLVSTKDLEPKFISSSPNDDIIVDFKSGAKKLNQYESETIQQSIQKFTHQVESYNQQIQSGNNYLLYLLALYPFVVRNNNINV